MTDVTFADLAGIIEARAVGTDRLLVAVAGPPASGKSTLAASLAAHLGDCAAVLPMDGFHLDNDDLEQMGLLHRKGAPETFDAVGFVRLLRKLRGAKRATFPTFDREADRTVPDGGQIDDSTRIVLVEGNYLLLDMAPWSELAEVFDLTVRLDVSREALAHRLVTRWRDHGLSEAEARKRAFGNDMKNADFVTESSRRPDMVLRADA